MDETAHILACLIEGIDNYCPVVHTFMNWFWFSVAKARRCGYVRKGVVMLRMVWLC